jgi:hypothetical protein
MAVIRFNLIFPYRFPPGLAVCAKLNSANGIFDKNLIIAAYAIERNKLRKKSSTHHSATINCRSNCR